MKVFLDRNAMAARGITVNDVEQVIRAENGIAGESGKY